MPRDPASDPSQPGSLILQPPSVHAEQVRAPQEPPDPSPPHMAPAEVQATGVQPEPPLSRCPPSGSLSSWERKEL